MLTSPHLLTLLHDWRREAQLLNERYDQPAQARLTEKHIEDLQNALNVAQEETLSLKDAAAVCGYTADHLGRLVKHGTLKNYGTRGRGTRVRRGDLPMKGAREVLPESATMLTLGSTRTQIARAVINGQ